VLSLSLALFLTASDFLSGFLRYLLAPEFLGLVFLGLVGVWWWMGVRALCPTDPASLEEWVGGGVVSEPRRHRSNTPPSAHRARCSLPLLLPFRCCG